ncbi:MAG: glutamate-ammonia-ligase adenylyltransferase, partial [Pseudomonadota bacterium]
MKPDIAAFRSACPGVDESFLVEHLVRLSDRYFSRFDERDLCRHATGLAGLSPQSPVEVLLDSRRDGSLDCTVLAFDYPSEFSLLTGILAGMGFSVDSGDVFTYGRVPERSVEAGLPTGPAAQKGREDRLQRRRIIDHFSGSLETSLSFQAWAAELREKLQTAIGLLEGGGAGSVKEAKQRVNEMVVKRLAHLHQDTQPLLYPVQLEIDNENASFTRLKVTSEDTPAFLYALSTALSLHDISIEHVRIRTIHGRVEDELDLVDSHGRKILDPHLLGRVRLSVLLTKQFTTFLERAPDPLAALSRFEHLLEEMLRKPAKEDWLELLTNPHALQDLARLLGASDFLWEDFIRVQYESLLPMLQPYVSGRRFAEPVETLPERMEQALKGARSPGDREKRLNEFKDREIFLIDLDHILNPGAD